MALLLASFGSNVLIENDEDENKIGEAIDRIQRFFHFLIEFFSCRFRREKESNINDDPIVSDQVCSIIYVLFTLISYGPSLVTFCYTRIQFIINST